MKITELLISQWLNEKDNLRREFKDIVLQELEFQAKHNKIYIDELNFMRQNTDSIIPYFDLCYEETMAFRYGNIELREAWLRRNKTIRELTEFLNKYEVSEISFKSKKGASQKIADITVKEICSVLNGRFKNSIANEYSNTRIKSETARNDIILAIKPYYEYLHSNIFTSKGGKEVATGVILKTLEVFGYSWPDSEKGREPVIVVRQLYQKSRS